MKKFRKYLGLLFTLAMLLLSSTVDAHASNWGDEGGGGTEGPGNNLNDVKEGASYYKTGYMIWVSSQDGTKLSNIVFVPTYGNEIKPNHEDSRFRMFLINRLGQGSTHTIYGMPVHWGKSPFDIGCESAIESFVTNPYGGYATGGQFIMEKYLGLTTQRIEELLEVAASGQDIHLCFESFALMGLYDKSEYRGYAMLGSVNHFAGMTDSDSYVARYSHDYMPNNVYLTVTWGPLRPVTNPSGRHSSAEILSLPKKGYGFTSYNLKPNDQKQVVKIYTSDGNVEETKYTKGSSPYQVKDEDDYKVVRWATSEQETQATGTKANWNTVTSGCTLVQQGQSPQKVTMPEDEKAIFIEYEKEPDLLPQPSNNSEALRAYEVNYPYPKMVGVVSRTDTGAVPADYIHTFE